MGYNIIFTKRAKKNIADVPKSEYRKIRQHVNDLAENPRPNGYIKLKGETDHYRIRVGNYRIIYTIEDNILTVEIIKIAHRKDVYQDY